MISLSSYEKETIINFNEEEPTAQVYTFNRSLQNRLRQLAEERPEECYPDPDEQKSDNGAVTYLLPKSWIKINPTRILTEEQKEALRDRLSTINAARASKSDL